MACIIPRLLPGIWGWDQQIPVSPYFPASCGYLIFVNSKYHNFFSAFFPHLLSFLSVHVYVCICVCQWHVCVCVCECMCVCMCRSEVNLRHCSLGSVCLYSFFFRVIVNYVYLCVSMCVHVSASPRGGQKCQILWSQSCRSLWAFSHGCWELSSDLGKSSKGS